ncbi:MAG TPA: glycosyltransferase family 2 protein [Ureibacillus sp.]|nr:glycosyltransferase family 2 protein [Ureibacillus sp.]
MLLTNIMEKDYRVLEEAKPMPYEYIKRLILILRQVNSPWVLWSSEGEKWKVINDKKLHVLLASITTENSIIIGPKLQESESLSDYLLRSKAKPIIWKTAWLLQQLLHISSFPPSITYMNYDLLLKNTDLASILVTDIASSGFQKVYSSFYQLSQQDLSLLLPNMGRKSVSQLNMESIPTVSIVICAFNEAARIGWCIRSVLAQTFQDWELIVMDDGSCDDTYRVASCFKDSRIHLIRNNTNRGKAYALNEALEIARGTFLIELDADDWIPPQTLEMFVGSMEQNPKEVAIMTSQYHLWTQTSQGYLFYKGIFCSSEFNISHYSATPLIPRFYRTDLLRSINGWPVLEGEWGRLFEDIAVCDRLLEKYQSGYLNTPLYHRIIRSKSTSQMNKQSYRAWAYHWFSLKNSNHPIRE